MRAAPLRNSDVGALDRSDRVDLDVLAYVLRWVDEAVRVLQTVLD